MLLYRGFNNNYPKTLGVRPEQKGIWMTEDYDFAKLYANYFKNGAIAEVELDDNVNIANEYDCISVFEDDEDWQDAVDYICDLGADIDMDNQICDKLANSGYDGVMFDDSGRDCFYIFNRDLIKGYKIIKTFQNDREDAMESTINNILKNAGVKQLNESIEIRDEVIDVYGEEFYKEMALIVDDKIVGCIQYTAYDDKPYIQMIKVAEDERRKGYGTKLIKALQKEYPNSEINFGMTTDDGTKLVNSLSFNTKVNIEYDKKVKQAKKLKKWLDEFKEFTDKVYQQIDNNEPIAEKNRLYIVNNTDKWQKYKNKYEEILDWIRENKREKKFVKINEVKNLNEAIFFNDEVYNDWNDSYEQLTVILNPSIDWLRNELNKPHCWGFRFLHNTEDNLLYVWDCHQSFMHQQVFDIINPKWGKPGTNVIGIFDPEGVSVWEEMADDGVASHSIKLAKKLDGKLFKELYPDGYYMGICN